MSHKTCMDAVLKAFGEEYNKTSNPASTYVFDTSTIQACKDVSDIDFYIMFDKIHVRINPDKKFHTSVTRQERKINFHSSARQIH